MLKRRAHTGTSLNHSCHFCFFFYDIARYNKTHVTITQRECCKLCSQICRFFVLGGHHTIGANISMNSSPNCSSAPGPHHRRSISPSCNQYRTHNFCGKTFLAHSRWVAFLCAPTRGHQCCRWFWVCFGWYFHRGPWRSRWWGAHHSQTHNHARMVRSSHFRAFS